MNVHKRPTVTPEVQETLENIAGSLAIRESRYEQAEQSYKSLRSWSNRQNSSICQFDPQVHAQGSFGLGTAIPPLFAAPHHQPAQKRSNQNISRYSLISRSHG